MANRRNSGIVPLTIEDSNYLKSDPETDDEDSATKEPSPPNGVNKISNRIMNKLHTASFQNIVFIMIHLTHFINQL